MAEMSKYCKAYYAKDFRALEGWQEKLDDLRPETREEHGKEIEIPRTELEDDDILYLHDSYVVTDDVYVDQHVVFDQVTDRWKEACHQQLGFEIPVYEPLEITGEAAEDEAGEGDSSG